MSRLKPEIQKDIKDCGVSVMSWIIKYYDGYIPIEKLREDTFTDTSGTSAYHIVKAFNKWGFDSEGILEHDISSNKVYYPLIAHLSLENGLEHFVVIRKVHNNTVYLMDPSIGYVKYSIERFNKVFTGHIILVYPRSKIISFKNDNKLSEMFIKIINKEKFLIIKIIISSIIWTFLLILSSYYLKIGGILLTKDNSILKYFVISFALIIILKTFFLYIRNYYINHLSNLVDVYIFPEFLRHLFSIPLYSIKSRTTGEIVTRIEELNNIKSLFSDIFVSVFLDSIMILLSIIVLYIINSKLFLTLIIIIIIYIILGIITSKIVYKKVLLSIDYQTNFNSVIVDYINMYESIKNLNIIDKILYRIEIALSKLLLNNYKFTSFFNKTNFSKDILLEGGIFIINTYGFYLIINNNLTLIDLFTFNVIISYFIDPIKNIINILPKFNYIKATYEKLREFTNIEEERLTKSKISLGGKVVFQNVSYSYNNYDFIIKDCSFTIDNGSQILLNGPSGSGKSTICKLIYHLIDSSSGEIYIDNKNIKDIDLYTLRDNILYLSQNENLFTGTIRDNILAYRDINEDQFNKVCEICFLADVIKNKKMRYDSLIEDGSNISGGERQRIVLARGLLKDSNIIILDEALSEVDSDLEGKIIKNVKKYYKDKTIIYISHKNQTNNFNQIINIGDINGLLPN